jgi:hypothetical protein
MTDRKDSSCQMEATVEVDGRVVVRMSALIASLDLEGEDGRMFHTRQFLQDRADLMRVLGVIDLIGEVPPALEER